MSDDDMGIGAAQESAALAWLAAADPAATVEATDSLRAAVYAAIGLATNDEDDVALTTAKIDDDVAAINPAFWPAAAGRDELAFRRRTRWRSGWLAAAVVAALGVGIGVVTLSRTGSDTTAAGETRGARSAESVSTQTAQSRMAAAEKSASDAPASAGTTLASAAASATAPTATRQAPSETSDAPALGAGDAPIASGGKQYGNAKTSAGPPPLVGGAEAGPGLQDAGPLPPIAVGGQVAGSTDQSQFEQKASPAATDESVSKTLAGSGPIIFAWSGLSASGGTFEALGYDSTAVDPKNAVVNAAAALTLTGAPRRDGNSWVIGKTAGSGALMQITADGLVSASYSNPAARPSSTAPSTAKAVDTAKDFAAKIGVPIGEYTWRVDTGSAGEAGVVQIIGQRVAGHRAYGAAWGIWVSAKGVFTASGPLAPVFSLGAYPVVSPRAAVARLTDPRFASSTVVIPASAGAAVAENPTAEATATQATPSKPIAGSAIPWPVTHVVITSADLGLAEQYLPDGGVLLLPAYELKDKDGNAWSVIAVTDDKLTFAPR